MAKKKSRFPEEIKGFRAPLGTKARIDSLAEKRGCVDSQILRDALSEYLEREDALQEPKTNPQKPTPHKSVVRGSRAN